MIDTNGHSMAMAGGLMTVTMQAAGVRAGRWHAEGAHIKGHRRLVNKQPRHGLQCAPASCGARSVRPRNRPLVTVAL